MTWSPPWMHYYAQAYQRYYQQQYHRALRGLGQPVGARRRPRPGDVVERDSATGIEFVYVPAGRFSVTGLRGLGGNPLVREFVVEKPFLMSKVPVTQAQWAAGSKLPRSTVAAPPPVAQPRLAPIPAQPLFPGQLRAPQPSVEELIRTGVSTGQGGSAGPLIQSSGRGAPEAPPPHQPIDLPEKPSGATFRANKPVTNIVPRQAVEFAKRLNARLPSKPEWVIAAVGSRTSGNTFFPVGFPSDIGWFAENSRTESRYPALRRMLAVPFIWERARKLYDRNLTARDREYFEEYFINPDTGIVNPYTPELTPEHLIVLLSMGEIYEPEKPGDRGFMQTFKDTVGYGQAQTFVDLLEDPRMTARVLREEVGAMLATPPDEWDTNQPTTREVGRKAANEYGLFDMLGNVKIIVTNPMDANWPTAVGYSFNASAGLASQALTQYVLDYNSRLTNEPYYANAEIGMRLVKDYTPPPFERTELLELDDGLTPARPPVPAPRDPGRIPYIEIDRPTGPIEPSSLPFGPQYQPPTRIEQIEFEEVPEFVPGRQLPEEAGGPSVTGSGGWAQFFTKEKLPTGQASPEDKSVIRSGGKVELDFDEGEAPSEEEAPNVDPRTKMIELDGLRSRRTRGTRAHGKHGKATRRRR